MQETKSVQANRLKMDDFVIYERIRSEREGGGVAIGAKKDLNPVLIAEGEENVEAITIDITLAKMIISCTSAYDPQQRDSAINKSNFWEYLDNMAEIAWNEGKGFYLQGDLNSWLGSTVIPGDPNIQNENGKLFHNFLRRHPELVVVNSLPVCKGLITRQRDLVNGKCEKSVIDFVVVCTRVIPYITEMVIDEARKYITTNYTQSKGNVRAINSDHNTQFVNMTLKTIPMKEHKREIYNLKNLESQIKFRKMTDNTQLFSKCLQGKEKLSVKIERWKHSLDSYIKKSFRKIKVRKSQMKQSAAYALIDKRNIMKKYDQKSHEIKALDAQIANILLKEEIDKAKHFVKYCNATGTFPLHKMRKLKKQLWPKKAPSLPVAKKNHKGRLISSPKELLQTLKKEYTDRLRPRKCKHELQEHMSLVHETTKLKLEKAWKNKSPAFDIIELDKAISDLNTGKARDPSGLCSEIFKRNVMGANLKESLLNMLNLIKEEGIVPDIMKEAVITTIPKSGSKFELKNERGIFKLSVLRIILLRLIYNRKYHIIDKNMSESNIGARKGKGCRNHIWIINGINQEVNSSKKHAQLVVQSYDYTQMYDSMSLNITMSDLFDYGVQDDLLILLDEVNRNMNISINTSYGLTEPVVIPALVAQGDLFSPLQAAVQVDSMMRRLEEQDMAREEAGEPGLLYKYKGSVSIPSLRLMDDNLTVSEGGFKAEEINIFMNENSATKLLQFNTKKCKYLRMGNVKNVSLPNNLEVDSWEVKYDEQDNLVETEGKKLEMQEEYEIKYLGFVISGNASNVPNILDKKKKSLGTIRSITNMIKGLETFTVKNGLIYLNSLLRSSILYAGETYYNLSEKDLRMIEAIEEECLSKIVKTGQKCPRVLLYLETGHHPARFQIFRMMLNFLKYILDQEKKFPCFKIFHGSERKPKQRGLGELCQEADSRHGYKSYI